MATLRCTNENEARFLTEKSNKWNDEFIKVGDTLPTCLGAAQNGVYDRTHNVICTLLIQFIVRLKKRKGNLYLSLGLVAR
mmetsp:Transcript_8782/g.21315  ORF Transcript_8782/g.21315 Transcript_8782/m.21315 type:complete len:80 (+) Transcript_8782:571-810(+)